MRIFRFSLCVVILSLTGCAPEFPESTTPPPIMQRSQENHLVGSWNITQFLSKRVHAGVTEVQNYLKDATFTLTISVDQKGTIEINNPILHGGCSVRIEFNVSYCCTDMYEVTFQKSTATIPVDTCGAGNLLWDGFDETYHFVYDSTPDFKGIVYLKGPYTDRQNSTPPIEKFTTNITLKKN